MSEPKETEDSRDFDQNEAEDFAAQFDEAINDDDLHVKASVGETRDEEMERLRQSADSADKRVLQAQAEAENFRKRMRRDMEDQLKYAAVPMVTDILQVRDNLNRAIEAAGDSDAIAGLRDGVAMVAKQLDDALAKHGVREIPAAGELFDPNFHEAIQQMPSDAPEGTVAHVAATGFQMHERVIRPAQVIVSTGPAS
ncbi:heat shock protein GrpE [Rubripirellula amarantea]|uniref:Protein GrpE n=1 Tax=Rubripirellula amarantea TaxID=2527999 RepID=A0A5C5WWC0_9BACT|nr:nucleotide exchange factor GrpE [Rubripirellula amarantea]TWT54996.1 heat shock protein GrpE [Rubripirellula amarantea]